MSTESPPAALEHGAAAKLQILATEHWSLLATRSLTYTELLSRVTIFLAILSGGVITLALVAHADNFGRTFISIAIPILSVVVFTGMVTISRLNALNREDYLGDRHEQASPRVSRTQPDMAQYFITSPYDDLPGALQTLGVDRGVAGIRVGSAFHLIQTLPGMLTFVVAAVGGAIGALALTSSPIGPVIAAGAGFVVVLALMWIWSRRAVTTVPQILVPRFPSPRG